MSKFPSFNWLDDLVDPDITIDSLEGILREAKLVTSTLNYREKPYIQDLLDTKIAYRLHDVEDHKEFAVTNEDYLHDVAEAKRGDKQ